jgi:hypothetical protein
MRRLSTSYVAAFVVTIVTLFIVGACSQQPSPAPAIEPVVTPTSTLGDNGDELSSSQVVDQASLNNSTQGDAQTTDTLDPTATATQEDNQTTDTLDPTATATQEDNQTTDTLDPTATATQEDNQTTDTLDPTATATQADIETIIDSILAELLNDAMMNLRDIEEEMEADMALLVDDEQALIGVGE